MPDEQQPERRDGTTSAAADTDAGRRTSRAAARARIEQHPGSPRDRAVEERSGGSARSRGVELQTWVDLQVRQAMERGEFENLPGAGKPIEGLGEHHDPDWWLKQLVERERITVLPPSVALRKEDAELDATLDRLHSEAEVRQHVEDFNDRVIAARYSLSPGPPLITMPRDVDTTVATWAERRAARRTVRAVPAVPPPRRHWWNRRRQRNEGGS